MKKKEVVIVVPGVKGLYLWPIFIQKFVRSICSFFNVIPSYKDHLPFLKKVNSGNNIVLNWGRGISPFDLFFAKKQFRELLNKNSSADIKIIGFSLGGKIILDLISKKYFKNVKKIILVCPVNTLKKLVLKHPEIINIYSEKDSFLDFSFKFYAPINGCKIVEGNNIKNINLPYVQHYQFCANIKLKRGKYKGKSILNLINYFLKN